MAEPLVVPAYNLPENLAVLVYQQYMSDLLDLDTRLIAVPEVPEQFSTKIRFARMWKREPSGIILNQGGAFRQLFQPHLAAIFLGVGQVSLGQRFWDVGPTTICWLGPSL